MSGPIVRKYGFPNFEKIFGTREVQHGIDEPKDQDRDESEGPGLPPDLARQPIDSNQPESAGKMAPPTEFGSTGD